MQTPMSKKALLLKVSSDSRTIADDDPRQLPIPDILNLEQVFDEWITKEGENTTQARRS
jgi:hypothetical protein